MPLVVDKDKVRMDILMAFEKCMSRTPMSNVSLRDIAKEAGMSHANLLNYFSSKDDLVVSYARYIKDYISDLCVEWFHTHSRKRYKSNLNYMNAFMAYLAGGKVNESRRNATTQTLVISQYNAEIAELVQDQFREWRRVMELCLVEIYGDEVGAKEAEVMVALVAGIFLCNYTHTFTGKASDNFIGLIGNLSNS